MLLTATGGGLGGKKGNLGMKRAGCGGGGRRGEA